MAPFVMLIVVHVVSIMVQTARKTIEIPQMTSPQEGKLREQRQKVKREHDTRFPKGEEHLDFDGNVYENHMETIGNP